jgi:hypothetical protein
MWEKIAKELLLWTKKFKASLGGEETEKITVHICKIYKFLSSPTTILWSPVCHAVHYSTLNGIFKQKKPTEQTAFACSMTYFKINGRWDGHINFWEQTKLSATIGLYYKCFTIVIYDLNDIGPYYKTRDNHNWRS